MGYLSRTVCFATSQEAADAHYSGTGPSYTAGDTSYLSYYENVAGTWQITRKAIASDGTVTSLTSTAAPLPTFPECDQSQYFMDGMQIGWGIALAMIAVYSIKQLWYSR